MLFRRYGNRIESVVTSFDPYALNEIAFRRDRARTLSAEEFDTRYGKVEEYVVEDQTEGTVQSEAEAELLDRLERKVRSLLGGLRVGQLLLVENEQGVDYPKLRDRKEGVIVEGENRLYFRWRVDPPLRLGFYEPRDESRDDVHPVHSPKQPPRQMRE